MPLPRDGHGARILPSEEWDRLAHTELGPVVPFLDPEKTTIFVDEDDTGAIIGCWAAMLTMHAEGVWIAPEHRKRGRVAARLWQAMRAHIHTHGFRAVITAARTPEVEQLMDRRGGIQLRGATHYLLPMDGAPKRLRSSEYAPIGQWFHAQLGAHVTHDEDPTHDDAVGRALVRAIGQHDPIGAVEEYNHWALTHTYQPIRYVGRVDDREVVDFGDGTIVGVDPRYQVTVLQEPVCHS